MMKISYRKIRAIQIVAISVWLLLMIVTRVVHNSPVDEKTRDIVLAVCSWVKPFVIAALLFSAIALMRERSGVGSRREIRPQNPTATRVSRHPPESRSRPR